MKFAAPIEAYPLTWPAGAARTPTHARKESRFAKRSPRGTYRPPLNLTVGDEIVFVRNEINRIPGARGLVISTNLPTRGDGMPMASATARDKDPGVAVYWSVKTGTRTVPYVMPCDRWNAIADNLHAIGLSIEAMRGLDRWGAVKLEQAFAGFAALPPGSSPTAAPAKPWREVLGGYWPEGEGELDPGEILALARKRFKTAMAAAHPDAAGGDADLAVELNEAMEAAETELDADAQAVHDMGGS
jgi:hypothetical protein